MACNSKNVKKDTATDDKYHLTDLQSYSHLSSARITNMDLDIDVDFSNKIIQGVVNYNIVPNKADTIFLDSKSISVEGITVDSNPVKYVIGPDKKFIGSYIAIPINDKSKTISIKYHTSPDAEALQWLTPQQTAGKKFPFLYTQGEAILTRSWIPIQDSPGIRFTYNTKVKVPQGLLALMSASNPQVKTSDGNYSFAMAEPVPAYLIALAVGDLAFKALDNRSGVYADPTVIEAAAHELDETPAMIKQAETLFGPYIWGRYDILILPPAFPFGGMENPCLTFATPTIIAGDKSLSSLVAHELAHSWSGNLVTNGTWNDFWLNEGFTVYLERRIIERIKGKDYADMSAMIGRGDLDTALAEFKDDPNLTRLKLDLTGQNPDDGMSDIAYEKGYLFLKLLENTFGRDSLDKFLNHWFTSEKFKPVTTEILQESLNKFFGADKLAIIKINDWLYSTGLPTNAPPSQNKLFNDVDLAYAPLLKGDTTIAYPSWDFNQWLYFLRKCDGNASLAQLQRLDAIYHFSTTGNYEILFQWLIDNIHLSNRNVLREVSVFLQHVGRRKFVEPLYKALLEKGMKTEAAEIYKRSRNNYHFVTSQTIDQIFKDFKVSF
jgi:aminopeptidase N